MTDQSPAETLEQLRQLEQENGDLKTRLAIIRISEPISSSEDEKSNPSPSKRTSDVSAIDNPTPASLEADLTHYKELFSKLRFSYVEQVTKEKFLRAIVGDPPLVVGHNENVEMEAQLAEVKSELKSRKEEVRIMIEDMEKMGRDLASRYKKVQLQMTQLSTLPESIENLESTIAGLRAKQVVTMGASSSQNLPLPATLSLLAEREAELAALNRQLAAVQNALPRKTREAEALERELSVLERRRSEATAQAREAQRMKQEGKSDGLEELGRWYRSAEETLKSLVGVEG
ncbi:hypothetical protein IFM61606_07243 [Aspergillus udagawae]|uniref:Kinetochore protein Sos7 coiled-coil domain-containing protein n=1 Tax=Aspergillus udagawae TaxID=91492 RepID=A0A8H3N921_9EURO|nr:uncharacterized protein Aud_003007 [Aspergillus udagawae]GFF27343.1 hypothetical protein IFM46972_02045 [Aspergillus udagawae]GFF37383.1 hypothetical protein IFM51744_03445 [Aspergillus udagawae]GFF86572.1 hypothetical protein IFM53868_04856 [Aspergillus udagawae]GFG16667.1 hypothetical protein IFM5058_08077 [Aspergillus udagawae]GFG27221.1 hypothetical protein IFM61606_07243 [Aspergillus udagawae]